MQRPNQKNVYEGFNCQQSSANGSGESGPRALPQIASKSKPEKYNVEYLSMLVPYVRQQDAQATHSEERKALPGDEERFRFEDNEDEEEGYDLDNGWTMVALMCEVFGQIYS